MITLIYRAIIALVLVLVVWCLFEEEDFKLQINSALVVIPMVLRLLMIK